MMLEDTCKVTLAQVVEIAEHMLRLADEGDLTREDVGCGVLYGTVRDSAYKIKSLALAEMKAHQVRPRS